MKLKVQNIPAFFFYGMSVCAFLATCIGAKHHIFILLSCLCLGLVALKSYKNRPIINGDFDGLNDMELNGNCPSLLPF